MRTVVPASKRLVPESSSTTFPGPVRAELGLWMCSLSSAVSLVLIQLKGKVGDDKADDARVWVCPRQIWMNGTRLPVLGEFHLKEDMVCVLYKEPPSSYFENDINLSFHICSFRAGDSKSRPTGKLPLLLMSMSHKLSVGFVLISGG